MPAKYQGQEIRQHRPARQGDQGFDQTKGEQVLITMPDGTQKVVKQEELDLDE